MKLEPGALLGNGKYRLTHHLGEGSQADVWSARQLGLAGFSKDVVLKCMDVGAVGPAHQQLMYREARLAASLRHPNIIEIYDVGEDDDLLYIAMEYIQGTDLDEILQQSLNHHQRPLPWAIATAIAIEVSKALYHAHVLAKTDDSPLHLVHRDLKPGNILLSEEGYVKVIDFGIAKAMHPKQRKDATHAGKLKGTPAYMSPEQIMEKPIDARSDLYSLGTILFELLTGRRPFQSEELFTMLIQVVQEEPPTARSFRPDLPAEIDEIVSKLLTKKPEERFQNARAVRRALESILRNKQLFIEPEDLSAFYQSLRLDGPAGPEDDPSATIVMPDDPPASNTPQTQALPDDDMLSAPSGMSFNVVSFPPDEPGMEQPTVTHLTALPLTPSQDQLPSSDEPAFASVDVAISSIPDDPQVHTPEATAEAIEIDIFTSPQTTEKLPLLESRVSELLPSHEEDTTAQPTETLTPPPPNTSEPEAPSSDNGQTAPTDDVPQLREPEPTHVGVSPQALMAAAESAPPSETKEPEEPTPTNDVGKQEESLTSPLQGLNPDALLSGGDGGLDLGLDDLDSIFASLESPGASAPSEAASMLDSLLPSTNKDKSEVAPDNTLPTDELATSQGTTEDSEPTENPEAEQNEPHNPDPTTPTVEPPSLHEAVMAEKDNEAIDAPTKEAETAVSPGIAAQSSPETEELETNPNETETESEEAPTSTVKADAITPPTEDTSENDVPAEPEAGDAAGNGAVLIGATASTANPGATAEMASFSLPTTKQAAVTKPSEPAVSETAAYPSFNAPEPTKNEEEATVEANIKDHPEALTPPKEETPEEARTDAPVVSSIDLSVDEGSDLHNTSTSSTSLTASPFINTDDEDGPKMPVANTPANAKREESDEIPPVELIVPAERLQPANYDMAALDDLLGYDDGDRTMTSPSPPSLQDGSGPPTEDNPAVSGDGRISLGIGQPANAMSATIQDGVSVGDVAKAAANINKMTLDEPLSVNQILDAHQKQGVPVVRSQEGQKATTHDVAAVPPNESDPNTPNPAATGVIIHSDEDDLFYLDPNEKTALNSEFSPLPVDTTASSSIVPMKKKTNWVLWILVFLGVAALGVGVFFFLRG